MNLAAQKKDWTLTSEAFERLLVAFDADRESAAHKYEIMRRKLAEFFEARGTDAPPDYADETINRVARRITEGEEIKDLNSYFYGVARLIWLEFVRSRDKETTPLELASVPIAVNAAEVEAERQQKEQRLTCLEGCLSKLTPANRNLIVEYYREEQGLKIETRKRQAETLNTTINGLRLRASRIRADLAKCVHGCVQASSATRNQRTNTEY